MIISQDGQPQHSWVVMKLDEYLREKETTPTIGLPDNYCEEEFSEEDAFEDFDESDFDHEDQNWNWQEEKWEADANQYNKKYPLKNQVQNTSEDLTNQQLLDRINADIDRLQQREREKELDAEMAAEQEDIHYEEI